MKVRWIPRKREKIVAKRSEEYFLYTFVQNIVIIHIVQTHDSPICPPKTHDPKTQVYNDIKPNIVLWLVEANRKYVLWLYHTKYSLLFEQSIAVQDRVVSNQALGFGMLKLIGNRFYGYTILNNCCLRELSKAALTPEKCSY